MVRDQGCKSRWVVFYSGRLSCEFLPAWTDAHCQFPIMRGLHLVEPVEVDLEAPNGIQANVVNVQEGRVTILTLEMLRNLVVDPEFEIRVTEAEIADKSKGDALSKIIFILQSSWFICQCIARHVQGLSLTQLELTTLALASLNATTFILWWDKPLGVQTPLRVYMKRKLMDAEREADTVSDLYNQSSTLPICDCSEIDLRGPSCC